MKPVVLLTSGTRGDVVPYLALAEGLRQAGRLVRVAAPVEFKNLVERRGLPFEVLDGNPSELMTRSGGQSALTYDGSWLRSLQATRRYLQAARPLYQRMLSSAVRACQGAGALVIGLPTIWGSHLAEALQIPCIWAFLQPFSRTGEFASPLLPGRPRVGRALNRLTYRLVEQAVWQPWRVLINRWRKSELSLPQAPLTGPFDQLYQPGAALLYGFSEQIVPAPADWPAWHTVTGYWFLDDEPWQPPEALQRFIEAHSPPVYLGFGSPGTRQPQETLQIVLQALAETGLRAALALPESMRILAQGSESIYLLDGASHNWLFPRMAALVHHGGAGTTAAGLRAGVPALLLPLAIDQFFWGERIAALGAGPSPLPQRRLSVERLSRALEQAVYDPALRQAASRLGSDIRAEKGVETAAAHITALL